MNSSRRVNRRQVLSAIGFSLTGSNLFASAIPVYHVQERALLLSSFAYLGHEKLVESLDSFVNDYMKNCTIRKNSGDTIRVYILNDGSIRVHLRLKEYMANNNFRAVLLPKNQIVHHIDVIQLEEYYSPSHDSFIQGISQEFDLHPEIRGPAIATRNFDVNL